MDSAIIICSKCRKPFIAHLPDPSMRMYQACSHCGFTFGLYGNPKGTLDYLEVEELADLADVDWEAERKRIDEAIRDSAPGEWDAVTEKLRRLAERRVVAHESQTVEFFTCESCGERFDGSGRGAPPLCNFCWELLAVIGDSDYWHTMQSDWEAEQRHKRALIRGDLE